MFKVVRNHKEDYSKKRKESFSCTFKNKKVESEKEKLNSLFAQPLLKVNISSGTVLVDRISKRYAEYL